MTARGALVAFGILLGVMGVVVALAAPEGEDRSWTLLLSGVMIVVAIGVVATAAMVKPRDQDRNR